jgi:SAM-dependent methyltransferase
MNRFHRWYCRSDHWARTLQGSLLPWALKSVELGDDVLEVGPGPGLTTDLLRQRTKHLTSIEIDPQLAAALKKRMDGTNVTVLEGDATRMPFDDASFSGAVSFTMLHHVPSPQLQDRLLTEVLRVLRPGGVLAGSDSTTSLLFRVIHLFDTLVPVDPAGFGARLEALGYTDVAVREGEGAFRFRARRPASPIRANIGATRPTSSKIRSVRA